MKLPPLQSYVDVQNLVQAEEWSELSANTSGRVHVIALTAIDGVTALAYGDQSIIQTLPPRADYDLNIAISPRILPDLNDTRQVLTLSLVYGDHVSYKKMYLIIFKKIDLPIDI